MNFRPRRKSPIARTLLVATIVFIVSAFGLQSALIAFNRTDPSQNAAIKAVDFLEQNAPSKNTATESPRFTIDFLSPYVIGNQPINLVLTTTETEAIFRVETLTPTNTRSDLYAFTDDLGKGRVKDSVEIALSTFTPVANAPGQYSVQIPIATDPNTSLSFGAAGVYPIAISQIDSNNKNTSTQYSFITNIPSVGSNGSAYSQKLNVVPLMEFSPTIDRAALLNEKGKITSYGNEILALFMQVQNASKSSIATGSPASLVLSPEALETYDYLLSAQSTSQSDAQSQTLFSTSPSPNYELISDTYVPINIAELKEIDAKDSFTDLMSIGRTKIRQYGYQAPSRTLITRTITQDSIQEMARSGIDNVIVDHETFARTERPLQKPVSLSENSATLKVAAGDRSIATHIVSKLSSSAKANFLIGATSVIALEAPSTKRGLILPLNLEKLDSVTISQFLASALLSPLISPISTETFFSDFDVDKNMSKKLEKSEFPKDIAKTISKDELAEIQKYSRASISMFDRSSNEANIARWMNKAVLSSSDRKIDTFINRDKARDLSLSVQDHVALPEKRTLTMTSRESNIPVTIRNTKRQPISVIINVSSDKLAFPKGSRYKVTLKEENTTIQIAVKSRTSGSFPVTIEIISPEESIVLAQQNATVRSTVLSGTGIAIALASTLFLALWWASHARKTKKSPIAPVIELNQENVS